MSLGTLEKKAPLLTPLLLLFMTAMIQAKLDGNMYGSLEALYLNDPGAGIGQIMLFYTLSQIIPLSHQQSRTSAIARGGFWLAEHQPGIGFLARVNDWGLFMGKGQPSFPSF